MCIRDSFLAVNGAASLTHQCLSNFSPKKEQVENWGLGFGAEGTQPSGNATPEELKEYDAHYICLLYTSRCV